MLKNPGGLEHAMWYVLDTSLLLAGMEPPAGARWATTPEAAAEVSPGGRDARRFEDWKSLGLQIRSAAGAATEQVDRSAMHAGNLGRLSEADRSLLALALELKATLLTDDKTMQDIALRLDIPTRGALAAGVSETLDWAPRCQGCGRWYEEMPKREECIICGSSVHLKRRPQDRG